MDIWGLLVVFLEILDFLGVGIERHGLLLLVEFGSVNLLERSAGTQKVLCIVHVGA